MHAWRPVAIGLVGMAGAGCNLLAPSCLSRQQQTFGDAVYGTVQANQMVVHHLAYDARGSQNDIDIEWNDRTLGRRLAAYLTRATCETGPDPNASYDASCRILSRGGSTETPPAGPIHLLVTHGRGNPEVLGNPPAYRVWLIADPDRSVYYTLTPSSFYGPDC
jgi:hypothetical protein